MVRPLAVKWLLCLDLKEHIAHPQLFENQTGGKLIKNFDGKSIDKIKEACIALGGEILESKEDLFAALMFLPRFPVYIKLWMSDDEIPGSGKMLFDNRCLHYLDEMDLHVLGPLLVDFLVMHYALIE